MMTAMSERMEADEYTERRKRIATAVIGSLSRQRRAMDAAIDSYATAEAEAVIELVHGLGYTPEATAHMLSMSVDDVVEIVESDAAPREKRRVLLPE